MCNGDQNRQHQWPNRTLLTRALNYNSLEKTSCIETFLTVNACSEWFDCYVDDGFNLEGLYVF